MEKYGNIGILEINTDSKIHNNEEGAKKLRKLFRYLEYGEDCITAYPAFFDYNHDLIDINDYIELYGDDAIKAISDDRQLEMPKYTVEKRKNGEKYKLRTDAVILIVIKLTYMRPYEGKTGMPCPLDTNENERKRFEDESLKWAEEKFRDPTSGRNNVVAAFVHYHESSPNIHIVICPEYNGKYDQNHYIGGAIKLSSLINSYNKMMHEKFGLELAKPEVHADRDTMKRTRKQLSSSVLTQKPIVPMDGETVRDIAKRANETLKDIAGYGYSMAKVKQKELNDIAYQIKYPDRAKSVKTDSEIKRNDYFGEKLKEAMEKQAEVIEKYSDIVNMLSDQNDPEGMRNEILRELYEDDVFLDMLKNSAKELDRIKKEDRKNL